MSSQNQESIRDTLAWIPGNTKTSVDLRGQSATPAKIYTICYSHIKDDCLTIISRPPGKTNRQSSKSVRLSCNFTDKVITKDSKMETNLRNWIGFWLLGLCNNYAYVIMLSAAHDLLKKDFHSDSFTTSSSEGGPLDLLPTNKTICNPTSASAILLADIVPSLITKAISPFLFTNNQVRVAIVIILSAASFLITCFSVSNFMTFTGVIAASVSSGLGEVSFLAYSANFDKRVVSGWSSGTGAAGLVGSGVYLLLKVFFSTRVTLGVQLIIPIIMTVTFYFLIVHPKPGQLEAAAHRRFYDSTDSLPIVDMIEANGTMTDSSVTSLNMVHDQEELSINDKLRLIYPLFIRFMLPLGLVYFFEYFINQGLYELMYFSNSSLSIDTQYTLFSHLYQVGVFVSRSSVQFIQIKVLWFLPLLQGVNFVLFLVHIIHPFFGSIYVAILLILFEGLLGGAAYVNTFYRISQESEPRHKSFNMSITSLADSVGITLAALSSLPTHDALCPIINQRLL